MTLSNIKDVLVLAALAFVIWRLIDFGEDRVKGEDVRAVAKQVAANTAMVNQWKTREANSDAQRVADMQAINDRIDAYSAPVIVRVPAYPGALPGPAAGAVGVHPASGPTDSGSGSAATSGGYDIDIRPAVRAFEKRYETALAQCREVVADWPTLQP